MLTMSQLYQEPARNYRKHTQNYFTSTLYFNIDTAKTG